MAIYSASLKAISRSAGRSATAAAAYRLGCVVIDERQGLIHDYSRRTGVAASFNFAPAGMLIPGAEALWNRAEHAEKRKNSTVARELLVALPHELNEADRSALASSIAQALADRYHVAGSAGIHLPDDEGDQRNHHVHIMFTTREYQEDGSLGAKTRVLDDRETGPVETVWMRQMVEEKTNAALAVAGLDSRVDCRSLEAQKVDALERGNTAEAQMLDRLPTVHEGPAVTQIRREMARHDRDSLSTVDRIVENDHRQLSRLNKVIDFEEAKAKLKLRREVESKQNRLFTICDDLYEAQSSLNATKYSKPEMPDGYEEYIAAVHKNNVLFKSRGIKTNKDKLLSFFGVKPAAVRKYEQAKAEMLTHYARDNALDYRELLKSWTEDIKVKSGLLEKLKSEQKQTEEFVKQNQHVLQKREESDISQETLEIPIESIHQRRPKRKFDTDLGYG